MYVCMYVQQVRGEGQVLLPSSGTNFHSAIPLIAHDRFCRTPVFSLWFANCRQTQQDEHITEHVSLAQSELR